MHKLTHFRLCPFSRSIRIALAEAGHEAELADERPWEWRAGFLALNPAGELPVLQIDSGPTLCGAYAISEYLDDEQARLARSGGGSNRSTLFSGNSGHRAEIRRLTDWFHRKMDREVTREMLHEKIYARLSPGSETGPDADILRATRANLRYHMSYIGHLAQARDWLAGDTLSFADMAAAAHLSSIDYLGEVPWEDFQSAKTWYARIKCRPSFRAILADRLPGAPPPPHYTNLDF